MERVLILNEVAYFVVLILLMILSFVNFFIDRLKDKESGFYLFMLVYRSFCPAIVIFTLSFGISFK